MKYVRVLGLAGLSALLISSTAAAQYGPDMTVMPNYGQNDIVIGNSDGDYGGVRNVDYEIYDASAGTWHAYRQADGDTWEQVTDNYQSGTAAGGPWYPQSMEFDNYGGIAHNANGNVLAVNFGNSYSGVEIYALRSDGGSDQWSSIWSSHCEAGGNYGVNGGPTYDSTLSERGGGLGVSPFNDKLSWLSYDSGKLYVLDYYDGGSTAGTGVAQLGQSPVVNAGVWAGNPRQSVAIAGGEIAKTGSSQGTCWLDNNTVAVFNAFGELVTADVSGVAGGTNQGSPAGDRTDQSLTNMAPTAISGWTIEGSVVATSSQMTDIEYNPDVDPCHIYMSETKSSGYTGHLYRVDYDPSTGTIDMGSVASWTLPSPGGNAAEPREIGLDSEGNLWISGYRNPPPGTSAGAACIVVNDILSNWGDNSEVVLSLLGDHYGAYSGMDVAASTDVLFDITGASGTDGEVDGYDLNAILANYGDDVRFDPVTGVQVDLNNDGTVDGFDLNLVLGDYGKSYACPTAVPEPGALLLVAFGALCLFVRRGR